MLLNKPNLLTSMSRLVILLSVNALILAYVFCCESTRAFMDLRINKAVLMAILEYYYDLLRDRALVECHSEIIDSVNQIVISPRRYNPLLCSCQLIFIARFFYLMTAAFVVFIKHWHSSAGEILQSYARCAIFLPTVLFIQ